MNFVDPKARPVESLVATDADGEFGHILVFVSFGTVQIRLQPIQEILIHLVAFIAGGHQADINLRFLAFFDVSYDGHGEVLSSATRVENADGISDDVHDFFGTGAMVVAVENKVKTRNMLCDPFCGVLTTQRMIFRKVLCHRLPARMKQTHYQIRMFFVLNDFHPLLGCSFQLLKAQTGTQAVGNPSDYIRRQKAEHGDFVVLIAVQYYIRCEIRFTRCFVKDIGAHDRHFHFGIDTVEHLAACFNIMVAHAYHIVREIIESFGNQIGVLGVLVGTILERSTLHVVPIVEENKILAKD